ncbi:hypothetical protein AWM68_07040 [Fictibacillus phosphorivorans]|uniref:DUF2157 domain-containing protein n=1 Tax=Fictibacillus phosphorivorans TaxID=1221500 RepID=A0A163R3B1_9BACL|nr:hypothetical protein [Fictibacillus phosphorivorans]KZE66124.1 hypothetical protein AWM68_07040 [Fictibacillus phosphorivorans]
MNQTRFIKDLNELKDGGYIKKKDYLNILDGYYRYRDDLQKKEIQEETMLIREALNAVPISEPKPEREPKLAKPITAPKTKIEITPEQRREKNITTLMTAGVILLLLGGLTLATSNWDVFSSLTKTMLVGGIAILFGGLGVLSEKVLQIRKTAFTFFVLFALFIPITVLSAGYFQLFGEWLSFYGEGRYVLGVLSTAVCIPIYFWFGTYFQSKLFIWLTFIASAIGYAYFILSFGLTKEAFYFIYALGNAGFIALYHIRKEKNQNIFLKTLPVFIQVNLILSTVLILIIFENQLYQSFNIILTAVLYLAMRMVNQRKEYELLFIGFITYGLYQLIQSSILIEYRLLLIVMVPLVLLLVGKFSDHKLKTYYQLANGSISILAFLYITFEGVLLSVGEGSVWLLLGYFVLAGNFIYLCYNSTFLFFNYLAPFYLLCAFMEVYHLIGSGYEDYWSMAIGISAALSYTIGQFLTPLKRSSLFVGGGGLLISFLLTSITDNFGQASVVSIILSLISVRHFLNSTGYEKRISAWLVPAFVFFSIFFLGMKLLSEPKLSLSLTIGSMVLLGVYIWQKKQKQLSDAFIATVAFTSILNFTTASLAGDFTWVKLLSSLLLMVVLWFATQHFTFIWGYAGIQIGLFFALNYTAALFGLDLANETSIYVYIVIAYILYVSEEVFQRIDHRSEYPIKAVSHLVILLTFLYGLTITSAPLSYVLIGFLYGIQMYRAQKEYEIRFSFYAGLTLLAIAFHYAIKEMLSNEGPVIYSTLLVGLYFLLTREWKRRLQFYIVPFSLFFLGEYITSRGLSNLDLLLHTATAIGFILFYQSLKSYWSYASVIVLGYLMIDLDQWLMFNRIPHELYSLIWFTAGLIITISGKYYFKQLYFKTPFVQLDFFAIYGIIYVLTGLSRSEDLLTTLGHVILAVLFYFQSRRLRDSLLGKRILQTFSSFFVLFAYYSFINQFDIPAIIQTELNVLPWISLSYVITRKTWNVHEKYAHLIQYMILGIVGISLMIDAIQSYQVMDAIILGTLSFISIIYGFTSKQKSYFFTGLIILLLNVLIQTRPYWDNMPWWVYLLLTGILLIGFASYNEFKKQKGINSPSLKESILSKWRHWFGEWK